MEESKEKNGEGNEGVIWHVEEAELHRVVLVR